jgi:hypothetical protein
MRLVFGLAVLLTAACATVAPRPELVTFIDPRPDGGGLYLCGDTADAGVACRDLQVGLKILTDVGAIGCGTGRGAGDEHSL